MPAIGDFLHDFHGQVVGRTGVTLGVVAFHREKERLGTHRNDHRKIVEPVKDFQFAVGQILLENGFKLSFWIHHPLLSAGGNIQMTVV